MSADVNAGAPRSACAVIVEIFQIAPEIERTCLQSFWTFSTRVGVGHRICGFTGIQNAYRFESSIWPISIAHPAARSCQQAAPSQLRFCGTARNKVAVVLTENVRVPYTPRLSTVQAMRRRRSRMCSRQWRLCLYSGKFRRLTP